MDRKIVSKGEREYESCNERVAKALKQYLYFVGGLVHMADERLGHTASCVPVGSKYEYST